MDDQPSIRVCLDTSVIAAYVIPSIAHHAACVQFCDELTRRSTQVYCSDILRIEFSDFWFRLPRTSHLNQSIIRQFRLGAWDRNALVRIQWMEEGVRQFEWFLDKFESVTEVPSAEPIWRASIGLMARYRLRSHDAIHVATALAAGVPDFASVDSDFRRVPTLRLHLLRDTDA